MRDSVSSGRFAKNGSHAFSGYLGFLDVSSRSYKNFDLYLCFLEQTLCTAHRISFPSSSRSGPRLSVHCCAPLIYIIDAMQRALASRNGAFVPRSLLRSRSVAATGFNVQQQRYAHKVCFLAFRQSFERFSSNILIMRLSTSITDIMSRSSSLESKPERLFSKASKP